MKQLEFWLEQHLQGKDMPLNLSDDMQDLHGLTLIDAIHAHDEWVHEKMENALRGHHPELYDAKLIGADHLCKLGAWIYADGGAALEGYAEFAQLKETHKHFHKVAGEIIDKHQKGKFSDAIYAMRNEFVDISREVKKDLVKLLMAIHR